MRFIGKTNIKFIEKRKIWYAVSATIILIGLISLIFRGIPLGIDFLGGTEVIVRFEKPVQIGDVRSAIAQIGLAKSEIKTYGTHNEILIRTSEQMEGTKMGEMILAALQEKFKDNKITILNEEKVGPRIGAELRRKAFYTVVLSLIVMLAYIGLRFKPIYGVGAVVALFHDVLVTLGFCSIFSAVPYLNIEMNQTLLAALLTLVGLSVNDTVVVFDRIRENLKLHKAMDFISIVNKSINETLSRTIITSGTVIAVLVILLFVGSEVTRGFAFALTIGMITGTYSSIYVASSIVVDFMLARQRKAEKEKLLKKQPVSVK
ncbi:protein translocase subunit SecF [Candidatus Chrysopegis kryptomonas]|uniref:Protein-export membrane protein SecF n=1 Tax=Candidatus Chryseopegocella kryptomonas TaxID=1633643 RepID=A0A0P1MNP5_9BACT|nr:protein translocase subunit SecF [Candidatus Chrysopegis kryptomonas]CUS97166.1 preprotein translocase subunit SecF [Candidatus Chrysopegis kryptomonas]